MVCLAPFTPDEFITWYRHLGRLRLFWAKPVVELFPLYRLTEGCVTKARWFSDKPRLEEAYIIVLRHAKKIDFLSTLRGIKILITPNEISKELYQLKGGLYIYSTSRPCATGVYLEKPPEGHREPDPDHIVLSSGSDLRYLLYLNRWNFNIDYLWLQSLESLDDAIESAICEARRHGGRFVTVATSEGHLDTIEFNLYKPDHSYHIYKLAF
ncbi:conserved hypothetical protein [Pyrobaculum islandicum DSM 4184]|uniref:Uncharacterized protein n=1 Tax=Pyrobaculum islandicum (strain DSM 4184 / JCM 9189 / GEO3) TaxID=384616 RepID=A1RS77_PYRIL|nr:hypothetical protein [Pyrobaculum islandicum]ABL87809.1 conserved hypothetical protein [Pyrobaculum islandicum DSM 4184]